MFFCLFPTSADGEHPAASIRENVETVETYAPTSRADVAMRLRLELQSEDGVGSLRGSAAGPEMRAPAHAEGSVAPAPAEGSVREENNRPNDDVFFTCRSRMEPTTFGASRRVAASAS